MRHPSIELNQHALAHNLQQVKQLAPRSQVVSMVKANAYGHGLEFAVRALQHSDAFGVACMQEALQIRALGISKPITLVEGVFDQAEWQEAAQQGFECVIHHQQQLDWALQHPTAYQQKNLKIWLKVNTGMNRLGLPLDQAYDAALQLRQAGFELVLTMHFANADEADHPLNTEQIEKFLTLKQTLEPILASCCNSAAILRFPALHFDYVRPGIMLYGSSPLAEQTAQQLNLQAVMTFKSHLIAIHELMQGEYIGYGSTYMTERPTRVGIVAAGYGDGYPRAVVGAVVSVQQYTAPLLGRVSMDMLAIDITDIPADIALDDEVILWGNSPSVDEIAQANNTISYELLCRITQRPSRCYQP